MSALLQHVLGPPPPPPPRDLTLRGFWEAHERRAAAFATPIDRAIVGGFAADRLGFAFATGYRAALDALLDAPCASVLCATEEGGAHPRAIHTALAPDAAGSLRLTGKKRWATLATEAEVLLVVASTGTDTAGRNALRLVRVRAGAPGVRLTSMPTTPFAPEIPHAELELDGVLVEDGDVLEGDGYERYLKPFRTIEDAHVHGALLGYLIGLARRRAWPETWIERAVAALLSIRAIAVEPPSAIETHIALAGLLDLTRGLVADADPFWSRVDPEEHERWTRDQPLLGVAGKARAARRDRAWARLGS